MKKTLYIILLLPTIIFSQDCTELDCTTIGFSAAATCNGILSYQWSSGETSASITVDMPGDYQVTVTCTDDSGTCAAAEEVKTFTVGTTALDPPVCTIAPVDIICETDLPVTIDATTTGGTPAYTFSWTPGGQTTEDISVSPPVGSTTYTLAVTDSEGCETTCTVTIEVKEEIVLTCPPIECLDGN